MFRMLIFRQGCLLNVGLIATLVLILYSTPSPCFVVYPPVESSDSKLIAPPMNITQSQQQATPQPVTYGSHCNIFLQYDASSTGIMEFWMLSQNSSRMFKDFYSASLFNDELTDLKLVIFSHDCTDIVFYSPSKGITLRSIPFNRDSLTKFKQQTIYQKRNGNYQPDHPLKKIAFTKDDRHLILIDQNDQIEILDINQDSTATLTKRSAEITGNLLAFALGQPDLYIVSRDAYAPEQQLFGRDRLTPTSYVFYKMMGGVLWAYYCRKDGHLVKTLPLLQGLTSNSSFMQTSTMTGHLLTGNPYHVNLISLNQGRYASLVGSIHSSKGFRTVNVSRDGQTILTTQFDGLVQIWPIISVENSIVNSSADTIFSFFPLPSGFASETFTKEKANSNSFH